MSVTVKIPTQLRSVTGGDAETQVEEAGTVGEVLDGLYDRYDGLRDRIAEDGDLRRFVNVYVGGEDIRFLDGLETSVDDGDEVTILPGRRGRVARPAWGRAGPRGRAGAAPGCEAAAPLVGVPARSAKQRLGKGRLATAHRSLSAGVPATPRGRVTSSARPADESRDALPGELQRSTMSVGEVTGRRVGPLGEPAPGRPR